MAGLRKLARRTFLIGSTAVAGGVAFGAFKMKQTPANPLGASDGITPLNPFVVIDQNGVTLIAPRAEMGQGVHTTWAALIAEELDVDWQDITVLHGPPAKAYYNSFVAAGALPFIDYKVSGIKQSLRTYAGNAGKLLDLQVTGGSTSMRDGFVRMRQMGATAREALRLAAAKRLGLTLGDLRTESGTVISVDGTVLSYQDLAVEAAMIEPPVVGLRDPATWRYLGKTMPRVDIPAKSTGTATYAIDTHLPGMRFATVRMSPTRAGMASFDATDALQMEGVEKVIDLGTGIAVVARNTWLAFQAADAVQIEWLPATYPATSDLHREAISAAFDGPADATPRDIGNVDKVTEGIEVIAEYRVPYLAHTTMEPMNATALYSGDALEVWSGNQTPMQTRDKCAKAVGLHPDAVTLHTPFMGGGFGRRAETDFSVLAALVAREMPDVPVKVTWSREEDIRNDYFRPAAIARFRGVVADGQAVALDGKIAATSVARQISKRVLGTETPGPDREHLLGAFDQPYGIPNYRVAGYLSKISLPLGAWRSVGNSSNGFFLDTFIDELAHAAKADPLQFRMDLIRKEHEPSAKVLEKVAEMSGWTGETIAGTGRGIAFAYSFGTSVAQVVEVIDDAGQIRVSKVWIACDPGIALDPGNIEAQMVGSAIYGLSAAISGEITFAEGQVEQQNFPDYDAVRMHNCPEFDVAILQNNRNIGGIGEPGIPPIAPALGNALFDLTGQRARELPFIKHFSLKI